MSAIISALDNYTPSQIGENGSIEYTWSNSIRERIVQLSFQLTRTRDEYSIKNLANKTEQILKDLTISYKSSSISKTEYIEYMSLLYRMIAHTRDIIDGKGEYALSYILLEVWNKEHPELAKFVFQHFLVSPEGTTDVHPYGSWKDVKYFYKQNKYSQLAQYGRQLLINQLKKDLTSENPSLAAKWTPREKSQFGEMFTELAIDYFSEYILTAKNDESRKKAIIKAKMDFRKLISKLNHKLDTVQIKQCSGHWSEIDPSKQTSITMHKQKRAFLNIDKQDQTGALGKMIAMVDVSGSMSGDPMNAAIALGIRVAEKSMLGKRVLTFSANPSWVNLRGKDTFIDMVDALRKAEWGMNTNFAAALNMILDAIITQKLKPEDVEDMVLAIFSDMQMDQADTTSKSLMNTIETKYADAGMRLWNKPFKAPHILFWNLRSTQGFPTLSSQKNSSMMSGFSPALLNLFCEEGLEALQSCTPWSLFVKSLENERYKILDQFIHNILS